MNFGIWVNKLGRTWMQQKYGFWGEYCKYPGQLKWLTIIAGESLMKVEYYMKVKERDNHLLFDHTMKRETLKNIIKD